MTFLRGLSLPRQHLRSWMAALWLGLSVSSAQALAAEGSDRIDRIVLVHGAFTDGSIWAPVISRLQAMGYRVTAVQIPLQSLADDVAHVARVLRRQDGPVLLVGHSWGGAVITQAGNAANVAGLAYLSALAPDSGESVAGLLQRLGTPMQGLQPDADGLVWLDDARQFRQQLAADLSPARARVLAAVQQPIAAQCFTAPVTQAAWRHKPSWYLQTEDDQALPLAAQHAIARQMGAHVLRLPSSHLSMQAHPRAVAAWLDRAARQAAHPASPQTAH
ncbi:alpha/beta fold hydrolase [Xanthomonas maliensis]|uniref:alpha/beta fold hydrolase n=1 Tax=Xanthomonas maliensis TaxID=1321368 RepID=UPI0003A60ACB|nr:alpha/beta hydrolase [Xanthomonas maliensis]KAB7769785.1 alpha/beta hydrolase [Xanthomonas maliensis]